MNYRWKHVSAVDHDTIKLLCKRQEASLLSLEIQRSTYGDHGDQPDPMNRGKAFEDLSVCTLDCNSDAWIFRLISQGMHKLRRLCIGNEDLVARKYRNGAVSLEDLRDQNLYSSDYVAPLTGACKQLITQSARMLALNEFSLIGVNTSYFLTPDFRP